MHYELIKTLILFSFIDFDTFVILLLFLKIYVCMNVVSLLIFVDSYFDI